MFGTERMYSDLEILAGQPDGVLTINLLKGTFEHSTATVAELKAARELSAWMVSRLNDFKIPTSSIDAAELNVEIWTNRIPTDRNRIVSFDLRIKSSLISEGRTFERTVEKHVYHHRPILPPSFFEKILRFLRSRLEWIRFQWRERNFFEAAKRLQPGMTAKEIRAILGSPTSASELNGGKDAWVYRRGTYWGLGSGTADYGQQFSLYLEVNNGIYASQRRSIVCFSDVEAE
jgi:hypothetical protein